MVFTLRVKIVAKLCSLAVQLSNLYKKVESVFILYLIDNSPIFNNTKYFNTSL